MSQTTLNYIRKEKFFERLLLNKLAWVFLLLFLFSYPIYKSLTRTLPKPLPIYNTVSSFTLIDQFGKKFSSEKLNGQISIASFAFTSCPTSCPAIMKKMQKIQKRVRGLGGKVTLLTFSVDPDFDTPKVLLKYANKLKANPYIWSFLTGDRKEIKRIVSKDFLLAMGTKEEMTKKLENGEVNIFDITHSGKVVLIDQKKQIRGFYSLDKNSINKLMIDTGLLVNYAFYNDVGDKL